MSTLHSHQFLPSSGEQTRGSYTSVRMHIIIISSSSSGPAEPQPQRTASSNSSQWLSQYDMVNTLEVISIIYIHYYVLTIIISYLLGIARICNQKKERVPIWHVDFVAKTRHL
jgi:hypothetical protein